MAVFGCIAVKTKISMLTILVLSAMVYAGGDQNLWGNAQNLAIYELFCLSAMFFVFEGKFGTRLMFTVFLMILTNVLCYQFEVYESIRQSIISLLFLSQCVITLKASYNTHKVRVYRQGMRHVNFWAFEDSISLDNKMVQ